MSEPEDDDDLPLGDAGAPPDEHAPEFVKAFYAAVNDHLKHTPNLTARDVAIDMVEWMKEHYPGYHPQGSI